MIRRFAAALLQLAAISVIAFVVFSVVPGDYYSAEGLNPRVQVETLRQRRAEQGLDRAWPVRYARWIGSCAKGDFGTSLAYGVPVRRLISPRMAATAALILPAWLCAWVFGTGFAAWAARSRNRLLEPSMAIVNMLPEVIVVGLLIWMGAGLRFPLTGVWLPELSLIAAAAPLVFLHAFAGFSTVSEANFVRIAESRGVAPGRLWKRFIFPAAAYRLISLIGPSLAATVGSSLVIEAMTGWPGVGQLFLEAVQSRDFEVVLAVVMLLAALLIFANLVSDLILYRTDPRIQWSRDGSR
jgi:peptide/nickel transport system permease protein